MVGIQAVLWTGTNLIPIRIQIPTPSADQVTSVTKQAAAQVLTVVSLSAAQVLTAVTLLADQVPTAVTLPAALVAAVFIPIPIRIPTLNLRMSKNG